MKVTTLPPNNTTPQISFSNLNTAVNFQSRQASLRVGDLLKLEIIADDPENNEVVLDWIPDENTPAGISFTPATSTGSVRSVLEWNIDCSSLAEGFQPNSYNIRFTANDNECFNALGDTVAINLDVEDIQIKLKEFIPANVFTPNNDGVNDVYTLPDLPLDDCTGNFLSFRVSNRWGTEVYVTIDRDFVWDAKGLEAGVYYYVVEYSNKKFNGQISILF